MPTLLAASLLLLSSLQYEFEPRRTVAEYVNAAANLGVPDKGTVSVRSDTQLYVTRVNDCDACEDAILSVHSGFLLEGSRFQIPAVTTWMANTYRVSVYSVEYRLASEGATYADAVDDVRAAVAWVRKQVRGKVVVVGASTGAGLVLSLARRGKCDADLAIADSPPVCMQTYDSDAAQDEYTSRLLDVVGKRPSDTPMWIFPSNRNESITPNCSASLTVPTLVLHSKLDPIVPFSQTRFLLSLPNATLCSTEGGIHVSTLSEECRSSIEEKMDALGVRRESIAVRTSASASAAYMYSMSTLASRYVPAEVVILYLCWVRMDPLLATYLNC